MSTIQPNQSTIQSTQTTRKRDIENDEVWAVVKSFFNNYSLLRHLIDSYDYFIQFNLPRLLHEFRLIHVEHPTITGKSYTIELFGHRVEFPRTNPSKCLKHNDTYRSRLFVDVKTKPPLGDIIVNENVYLGDIPVIVFSKLCVLTQYRNDPAALAALDEDIYDTGGYFVMCSKDQAHKRVIIPQERSVPNRISIFMNKKTSSNSRKPTETAKKTAPKYDLYAEVRTTSPNGFRTTTTIVGYMNNIITVVLPWYKDEIPIGIVFRALGVQTEEEILECVFGKDWNNAHHFKLELLQKSLEYSFEMYDYDMCIAFIGSRRGSSKATDHLTDTEYTHHILNHDLFCHLALGVEGENSEGSLVNKRYYLGMMIYELLNALYIRDHLKSKNPNEYLTDRDHFSSKRVMDVNILFGQQLFSCLQKIQTNLIDECTDALEKGRGANILTFLDHNIITNSFSGALINNKWSRASANGVSQLSEEFNYSGSLQHKRKLTVPLAANNANTVGPRDLHASHYSVICPSETPEGEKVGLLKNLALSALVSFDYDPVPIYDIVASTGLLQPFKEMTYDSTYVTINGDLVGITNVPEILVDKLRSIRRAGGIQQEISIAYIHRRKEVRVLCDYGRLSYPGMIVENDKLKINEGVINDILDRKMVWNDLCAQGYVELIDKDEEENILLASFPDQISKKSAKKYTHCELHPSLAYGVGASTVPFLDHDQAPRVCYQAGMGKASVGIPFLNFRQNISGGKVYVMRTIQRPLANSRVVSLYRSDEMPAGLNSTVFIMPRAYNEEDSIEIAKSAIDRGFMDVDLYEMYYKECSVEEKFTKPKKTGVFLEKKNYGKLCDDGYVLPGTKVEKGDVMICKVSYNEATDKEYVDIIEYSERLPGRIDRVDIGIDANGKSFIRISVVQRRRPAMGDKFSARHGQKGTVGMIWNQEDLPFEMKTGMTPDLIINSLALPSRMTIAMLIEMVLGTKVCSKVLENVNVEDYIQCSANIDLTNNFYNSDAHVDATAFKKLDGDMLKKIRIELKRYGIYNFCDEYVCDGVTGKLFKCLVFKGQIFYQRLKHIASSKIHARARGGKNMTTRQPNEGRSRGGGIKTGCMERDCLLAQGASATLNNCMMDLSDRYTMYVCKACGMTALFNPQTQKGSCIYCNLGNEHITKIAIPYGTKSVLQKVAGMNMVARIMID